MKPTIKVSISGVAFNLEEDAYRLLKQYLERLQRHYEKVSGGKEIVEDIELRIAELMGERIDAPEQVISETVAKEVLAILGQPEEIGADDTIGNSTIPDNGKDSTRKKLYRDIDHKVFGGVCSGLATYFNIDVVLVRVLFVVFFIGFSMFNIHFFRFTGGTTFFLYILLWIITPPARTVQQRFEMHGETPTVKNIQRKVEEELHEVKRSAQKTKPVINEIFRVIGKICMIVVGICLVLVAIGALTIFIAAMVSGQILSSTPFSDIMEYVDIQWHPWWFFALLSAVLFLPFLGILYGGIKLLFNIKTNIKIGLIIFLVWLAALFTMIGIGIFSAKSFFHWRTVHEYVELPAVSSDTLYIDIPQKYYADGTYESVLARLADWGIHHQRRNGEACRETGRIRLFGHTVSTWKYSPDDANNWKEIDERSLFFLYKNNHQADEELLLLPVVETDRSTNAATFTIDIRKSAAGKNSRTAYTHARQLLLNYQLKDSLLTIDPLVYTKDNRWTGELLRLRIRVPEGKAVIFGKAFRERYEIEETDWE